MPKQKPENKLTDKERYQRYKDAARELGIDEQEGEKLFEKLAWNTRANSQSQPRKSDDDTPPQ